jgi:hypothetical protein
MFQYVKSTSREVGDEWLESTRFTRSIIHNRMMSGEQSHIKKSKSNHLKWISQVW